QREDLLYPLRPRRAFIPQHLDRLAQLRQSRVVTRVARPAADAVQDRGQVQDLGPRLEKERLQGGLRAQGGHEGTVYCLRTSSGISSFRLPVRSPSRSIVTKRKPSSFNRRASGSRTSGAASRAISAGGTSTRASSPSCRRTRQSRRPS